MIVCWALFLSFCFRKNINFYVYYCFNFLILLEAISPLFFMAIQILIIKQWGYFFYFLSGSYYSYYYAFQTNYWMKMNDNYHHHLLILQMKIQEIIHFYFFQRSHFFSFQIFLYSALFQSLQLFIFFFWALLFHHLLINHYCYFLQLPLIEYYLTSSIKIFFLVLITDLTCMMEILNFNINLRISFD